MTTLNRVIIIDDDPINNMLCDLTIRRLFPEVKIKLFLDPEEALEIIKKDYPKINEMGKTILFLDLNMPQMSGWEFLDMFNDLGNDIKKQFVIYVLSSSVDTRDRKKTELNPLVSGFLYKPLGIYNITEILKHDYTVPQNA